MSDTPRIQSGEIVAKRLFEIAYAIDLRRVEQLWDAHRGPRSRRRKLSTAPPKAVAFGVPPVVLELDAVTLELDGVELKVQISARLYDFGVASLALQLPVADCEWAMFVGRMDALDRLVGPQAEAAIWQTLLAQVVAVATPAFDRPMASDLQEDYLYAFVRSFDRPLSADEVQQRLNLVPLLSGEKRALAEGMQRELLRQRFSYFTDDLAILTWDRAFLYDPRGDTDVADVLEIANAQLLEMRYYDELLDGELPRIYDLVEVTRRSVWPVAPGRFAKLARKLHGLVAEVTELKEKVDNALQVTEDVYLARIYGAALEQFRVPTVSQAVDRKLAIVRDTYIALYDEASSRRAEFLEVTIVLLIAVELALALLH